jgi:hypothetical protein
MRIEFNYIAEDYVEANVQKRPETTPIESRREAGRSAARMRRLGRNMACLSLAGILLAFIGIAYLIREDLNWAIPAAIAGAIILFVAYWHWPGTRSLRIRKVFNANPHNAAQLTIEVDLEGFHFVAPRWQCHLNWKGVCDFYETPSLWVIVDDEPTCYLIPKRAFPDQLSRDEFCRFIKGQIAANPLFAE